jgi:hypothetical protein
MRFFSLFLLIVLSLGAAHAQGSRSGAAGEKSPTRRECFIRDLGELLVFDSTHLAATAERPFEIVSEHQGEAGEGGATSQVFYLGNAPKLIVMKYAGPWSRIRERYFLGDSADFVVERDELYFDQPLPDRAAPPPPVVSHVPRIYYFCGGRLFQGGDPEIARNMIATRRRVLKETLNRPRRSGTD